MGELGMVRGIEHVGITVPSIEEATVFFAAAFGAEVLYDMAGRPAAEFDDEADRDGQAHLGTRPGVRWAGSRMLRLANGPAIELFEYDTRDSVQRRPRATSGCSTSRCWSRTSMPSASGSSRLAARRSKGRRCCPARRRARTTSGCTRGRHGVG